VAAGVMIAYGLLHINWSSKFGKNESITAMNVNVNLLAKQRESIIIQNE
jgi:hypothetical protein